MACSDARVCGTWSVRYEAGHPDHADRVLEEVSSFCRELCSSHFTEADGYTLTVSRLSGPLEGANIVATRGDFRALVSVQRFDRVACGSPGASIHEIRVVASAHHQIVDPYGERGRALTRWTVAGCAAGTMGLGALTLEVAGLLTAWSQILLLLPAIMAWRTFMALEFARRLRRQAHARNIAAAALEPSRHRALDLDRWMGILGIIETQREAVEERFRLQPFRSAGVLPGSVGATPPAAPLRTLALHPSVMALTG